MKRRCNVRTRMRYSALIAAIICAVLTSCGGTSDRSARTGNELREFGSCYIGGCSSELCTDEKNAVSICIYRRQYECYQTAICERDSNEKCGWRMTEELRTCLESSCWY
jgi:hypothetical protein